MKLSDYPKEEVQSIIENAKANILDDIEDGTVPKDVKSFSELHEYRDANFYGGFLEDHYECSEGCELENKVQEELDVWIKNGMK